MQQTADGGYIVVGWTDSYGAGAYDVYPVKTSAYGTQQWQRTEGGASHDYGWSVQQTADGGYIVAGETMSCGEGEQNAYLIKTDASGGMTWFQTFGDSLTEEAYSVRQTTDGGYIIAGATNSRGAGESDVLLVKTDANGTPSW